MDHRILICSGPWSTVKTAEEADEEKQEEPTLLAYKLDIERKKSMR